MKIQVGVTLQGRWKVIAKLSVGFYSKIFLAEASSGREYAVKVDETWWISEERKIYERLHSGPAASSPLKGIPRVIGYGYEEDLGFLVLPRLGVSLHQVWMMCHRRFTHTTIAKIAIQALERLEAVHRRGVVHNDLIAKNFVMGSGDDHSTVHLIDYSNARKFTDRMRGSKFNPKDNCESCPRDDLIALVRMLIKFHRDKNLKWLREVEHVEERRGTIKYLSWFGAIGAKRHFSMRSARVLHYWEFMRYVDLLRTTQMPDYQYMKGLFKKYLDRIGERDDNRFQWMELQAYKDSLRM